VKFPRLIVVVIALALMPLTSQPLPSSAQSAPSLQNSLNTYLQGLAGVPENATITAYYSVAIPCPPGRSCTWTTVVVLAAYALGDSGGQAIFSNNPNCPSCFGVLGAGGGVMSLAEVENFGIDATTAQALITNL